MDSPPSASADVETLVRELVATMLREIPANPPPEPPPVARIAYRMQEAADALGVSRAWLYEEAKRGELRTIKLHGARRVLAQDLHDYAAAHANGAA